MRRAIGTLLVRVGDAEWVKDPRTERLSLVVFGYADDYPDEVAELTRLAKLATDFDSGSAGMSAERALSKEGRKAVPFLLSEFETQYNGGKWAEQNEQFERELAEIDRQIAEQKARVDRARQARDVAEAAQK